MELKGCKLIFETSNSKKDNKTYENMFIETPKGTRFQVRYSFYNGKLDYKLHKECEGE